MSYQNLFGEAYFGSKDFSRAADSLDDVVHKASYTELLMAARDAVGACLNEAPADYDENILAFLDRSVEGLGRLILREDRRHNINNTDDVEEVYNE